MNAIEFLRDKQANAGVLRWNGYSEHTRDLVSFWAMFNDQDRPFSSHFCLRLRDYVAKRNVPIPLMMFSPSDLIELALFNGAEGKLTVPRNYR